MLPDLVTRLRSYADGSISRSELEAWLLPIYAADPLDVAQSDAAGWDRAPDETRLFWRLAYLIETSEGDEDSTRRLVGRVLRCLERTRSPATTLDLLPILGDQERLCVVVERHGRGIVSRTGFLSLVAESGYPAHVKAWLRHAGEDALARLCDRLAEGSYDVVAPMLEHPPDATGDDAA